MAERVVDKERANFCEYFIVGGKSQKRVNRKKYFVVCIGEPQASRFSVLMIFFRHFCGTRWLTQSYATTETRVSDPLPLAD